MCQQQYRYQADTKRPQEVLFVKCVLKNDAKFTEKPYDGFHLHSKVVGLQTVTFLKKLNHRCFPKNSAKCFRAATLDFFYEQLVYKQLYSVL